MTDTSTGTSDATDAIDATGPAIPSPATSAGRPSFSRRLDIPWRGLRPDLILHPGPMDPDGHQSWVLEDPVRGNNFRLGYAEGELVYRLSREPDLDRAIANLYQTTPLRPAPDEVLAFIRMLQNESLARLPHEEVLRREREGAGAVGPPIIQKLVNGAIFFRIPLIRPDRFLSRTLSWVRPLWSPPPRWLYLIVGILGLALTLPEIELYLGTVSYLFTPMGMAAFAMSLILLKIGHEFAHAYAAKAMGLHVRSMGLFFIVFWPLLYTDTTDAWKLPDRRRRMWIAGAGVLFEAVVAGLALFLWALLPDGILRSLMFFLSGASLISSIFINLNPFLRYDGYYMLMDWWGVDNLRPRALDLLRHDLRRRLLGWRGGPPEIHPNGRAMILYGWLALCYRLFVGISIAIAVYYLLFPILGLAVFAVELWLFVVRPGAIEIKAVIRNRHLIGSRRRTAATLAAAALLAALVFFPIPRYAHVPGLILHKGANRMAAPVAGQLALPPPKEGGAARAGDLLGRIESESLRHEAQGARFDLASVEATLSGLSGGGQAGAYRSWLLAERERLTATIEKLREAEAMLEIRAPIDGRITDVNPDLYEGAHVGRGAYLFTVSDPTRKELRAFVHEGQMARMASLGGDAAVARARLIDPTLPPLAARLVDRSRFPVAGLPNESLMDVAGGPIVTVADGRGRRPRDAYFAFDFAVEGEGGVAPIPHGMPCWIWVRAERRSIGAGLIQAIWRHLTERGLF